MSVVSRFPSSTMIARFSVTWRIARSTLGSSVTTVGKTTSDSRREMSFEKPTTEVSGVRSSWLTLDRKWLLATVAASAAARASTRSAVRSATRRSSALRSSASSPNSRALSMPAAMRLPTVYSSGPSPGWTSRPVRPLSTARIPTVRPLVTSGVPRNDLTPSSSANARLRSSGSWSASRKNSGPSAVASWTSWDAVSPRSSSKASTCAVISGVPPAERPAVSTPRPSSTSRTSARSNRRFRVSAASERSSSASRSSVDAAAMASSLMVTRAASRCSARTAASTLMCRRRQPRGSVPARRSARPGTRWRSGP